MESGVTGYESEASRTIPTWNQLLGWLREMTCFVVGGDRAWRGVRRSE
jgi:hypothetical protein